MTINDCPFCGLGEVGIGDGDGFVYVVCHGCIARGPMCDTREEAINAWNAPTIYMDTLRSENYAMQQTIDALTGGKDD